MSANYIASFQLDKMRILFLFPSNSYGFFCKMMQKMVLLSVFFSVKSESVEKLVFYGPNLLIIIYMRRKEYKMLFLLHEIVQSEFHATGLYQQ